MRTLRYGHTGEDVEAWQSFLRGQEVYFGKADGHFGLKTKAATEAFQTKYGLDVDGKVGNQTFGKAMSLGFSALLDDDDDDEKGAGWPPKAELKPLDRVGRDKAFGHIECVPAPTSGNPEGIKITNNWSADNIITVEVPQLVQIPGMQYQGAIHGRGPKNGKVAIHKKVAQPFIDLWDAWEKENLLHLIKTWGGLWNPRYIRGYQGILSNHAYASAFDINVPWNLLGHQPALVGRNGSVRELVPVAVELGWYWGGWFGAPYRVGGRQDGMHFEFAGVE
jgi:hypothetical protein